jgi:hypothetical protein
MSRDPAMIHTGGNSGYQAVNLVRHFSPARILLLGYDMRPGHWHGKHPRSLSNHSAYGEWIVRFRQLAQEIDVPVFNCTPGSALDCFPLARLEVAL